MWLIVAALIFLNLKSILFSVIDFLWYLFKLQNIVCDVAKDVIEINNTVILRTFYSLKDIIVFVYILLQYSS